MIYHLSLRSAGLIAGAFLCLLGIMGFVMHNTARIMLGQFPRSRVAGVVILGIDLIWSFWLISTMEMGEFSTFRRPFLIALPIGFFLAIRFVDEFLAVRALGILALLAAEPLLEAAFFRYETSRLVLTILAYLLIVAGLFWVTMPYLLRDQINWSAHSSTRWRTIHGIGAAYGLTILACAFTQY